MANKAKQVRDFAEEILGSQNTVSCMQLARMVLAVLEYPHKHQCDMEETNETCCLAGVETEFAAHLPKG